MCPWLEQGNKHTTNEVLSTQRQGDKIGHITETLTKILTPEIAKETILSLEAEVREHKQKNFVTLSKFWPLRGWGWG